MANNRQCLCCGVKYSFCPNCSRIDALKPAWHSQFCSADCMTLWTTATKYNMHMIEKSEAKEVISALELKSIDTYAACVQRDLGVIFAIDEPIRKNSAEKPHEVVKMENE